MKDFKTDVPVLLVFFARPDTFKEVFEAVKKARPSKLFLACDGPRENRPDDIEKVAACKKIAEDIDWECEVHTNYAETNMGCGMRPQTAISWAFSMVDRLVVLEDDCVPHAAFFPYMEEMLEKYKDDERISNVSGFNHFADWDCGNDSYFFAKVAPLAGAWGSWRRVWDNYDYFLSAIDDSRLQMLIENDITHKRAKKGKLKTFVNTRKALLDGKNISHWDYQFLFTKYSQSRFGIVPRVSLASNIGLGEGATHGKKVSNNPMPTIFFAPERQFPFPLTHPKFIVCDHRYDDKVDGTWAYPNPLWRNWCRAVRLMQRVFKR